MNIDHGLVGDGTSDHYFTVYAHLTENFMVADGQSNVMSGDPIGFSDNSGRSCGEHLHFGLHRGNPWDDAILSRSVPIPRLLLRDRGTPTAVLDSVQVLPGSQLVCGIATGHFYEAIPPNVGCVPPPNNLVAWWRAENDVTDTVGPNDGTLMNGSTFGAGMVGQAFQLDGADDFVRVPDSELWNFGSGDFTIDLWANFTSTSPLDIFHPDSPLVANNEGGGTKNKWLFGIGGQELHFLVGGPGVGAQFLARTPFAPILGRWYHLAVTRSGPLFTTYIDGVPVGMSISSVIIPNASAPLSIGESESFGMGQNFFTHGLIDEVEIFHRALSAAEIQQIVAAGSAGKCPPDWG